MSTSLISAMAVPFRYEPCRNVSNFLGSPVDLGVTHRWGSAIWMPEQER